MEAAALTSHPLGRLLVARGLLTEAELDEAILFQELTGRALGATLLERGYVTTSDLAGALAGQLGLDLDDEAAPQPRTRRHLRLVGPDEKPAPTPRLDPLTRLEAAIGRTTAWLARAEEHLLFAPVKRGYTLVERDGPPPPHGSALVLDGTPLTVAKLGRSPLPGDARPCAFLQR